MGTSIVSPGGMNTQAIDQAFGNIYSMFGSGSSGGSGGSSGNLFGTNITTPSTMSVGNPNNTGMYSQATSVLGTGGGALLGEGGSLVGTGTGISEGALPLYQGAYDTTGQALSTMQPSIDYYTKLASGDPSTVASAAAPYATTIQQQLSDALNKSNQGMPQGGYAAMTRASLPTAAANQITGTELANQQNALQQLQSLAGTQNTIAGTQSGISGGVAGTGQGITGTGTTLTGQGLTAEQQAAAEALQKLQFNAQTGALATLKSITGDIGSVGQGAGSALTGLADQGIFI